MNRVMGCIIVLTWALQPWIVGGARAAEAAEAEAPKLVEVEARGLKLRVPETWKRVETDSKFRVVQFDVPAKEQKGEAAELVVYEFGGPTGGVQANVNRWVGQFHEAGRKVKVVRGKSKLGAYVWADISGTWKKPDGPPFARKTVDKPDSRVIGVILMVPVEQQTKYFFFKFGGPDALVASQAKALRASFGGDVESEKPYKADGKSE